ncbi:hypothetical protein [Vibrio campbellii]|uniref:hypothetical protein n=1 Tax=Vibrio campbellii TaxID=680 RepID=UPI0012D4A8AE|nr:hypothetical protein [Vibrio campbellii]
MENIEIKNRAIELYKRGDSIPVIKAKLNLSDAAFLSLFNQEKEVTKPDNWRFSFF